MITFDFLRQSSPFDPGYNDRLTVLDDIIEVRTWPNEFRPSDGAPCYAAYGAIDIGEWLSQCVQDAAHGKHLVINSGVAVPCVWPNPNHKWQRLVTETLFHRGKPEWPGSAACFTAPDPDFSNVMGLVAIGETVLVRLRGPKLVLGVYDPSKIGGGK